MTVPRGDDRLTEGDRRFVRRLAAVNVALFSLLVTGQWLVWSGMPSIWGGSWGVTEPVPLVVARALLVFAVSLVGGLVAVTIWRAARQLLVRRLLYGVVCAVGALLVAVPQALVLAHLDRTPIGPRALITLWVTAALSYAVAIGAAVLAGGLLNQYRRADHARRAEENRAAQAVADLEAEELRVRRMVADKLHGTIQNRLVVASAGLAIQAQELADAGDAERAAELRRWAEDLDDLREQDVRTVSHALFPTGANIGTVEAISLLLARLPPSIATAVDLGPNLRALSQTGGAPVPIPTRLTMVYAVEEAVTNALKHGARSVRVAAEVEPGQAPGAWRMEVMVDDDGTGLDRSDPPLHGLERHRARIQAHGGTLTLEPGPDGGARLHLALPFTSPATGRRPKTVPVANEP